MLHVMKERYFQEHYENGYVETGLALPAELVDEIQQHYRTIEDGHNDFPKFFVNNEHQAYIEGRLLGMVFNTFPGLAKNMIKRLYDRAYHKAVYCEQTYIEKVLQHVMANGFGRFFETRYIVAAYDMYLRNSHRCPAAGIHSDLPNFHHFYETENDLSIYIPLVDLDDDNGGRITVLPESLLKMPGNVLLKLLYAHFSQDPACLDGNGYVDPDKIDAKALQAFVKTRPHQELMSLFKSVIALAKTQYAGDFRKPVETKGTIVLFNNKNFHAAEPWKNETYDREVYVIRMFPIYDARIRLKRAIHGTTVNNYLLDMHEGSVTRFDDPVDLASIPAEHRLPL